MWGRALPPRPKALCWLSPGHRQTLCLHDNNGYRVIHFALIFQEWVFSCFDCFRFFFISFC